jgi:hypothetical protein
MSDWVKQTWAEIKPNFKWDVTKWTASGVAAMVAAGVGLFQKIVHLTVDLGVLGAVFVVSFVASVIVLTIINQRAARGLTEAAQPIPPDAPQVIIDFDWTEKRPITQRLGQVVRHRHVKLLNRGGDAFDVQIEPMNLEEHVVTFERVTRILSGQTSEVIPHVERKGGEPLGHLTNEGLDLCLTREWENAGRRGRPLDDLEFAAPTSVVYCDRRKQNWYRTRHEIRFDCFHQTASTALLGYERIFKPQ